MTPRVLFCLRRCLQHVRRLRGARPVPALRSRSKARITGLAAVPRGQLVERGQLSLRLPISARVLHRVRQQRRTRRSRIRTSAAGHRPEASTSTGCRTRWSTAIQPKQAVTLDYWDESHGVDRTTGQAFRSSDSWPGDDAASTGSKAERPASRPIKRSQSDRHLLIIDCTNRHLYGFYNVYYNAPRRPSGTRGLARSST